MRKRRITSRRFSLPGDHLISLRSFATSIRPEYLCCFSLFLFNSPLQVEIPKNIVAMRSNTFNVAAGPLRYPPANRARTILARSFSFLTCVYAEAGPSGHCSRTRARIDAAVSIFKRPVPDTVSESLIYDVPKVRRYFTVFFFLPSGRPRGGESCSFFNREPPSDRSSTPHVGQAIRGNALHPPATVEISRRVDGFYVSRPTIRKIKAPAPEKTTNETSLETSSLRINTLQLHTYAAHAFSEPHIRDTP